MQSLLLRLFLAAVACSLFSTVAFAQTAQVTGTVTDSTGAVIAHAKVLVTNVETRVARESLTNERGNYLVTSLLPGRYEVMAESPGFRAVKLGPVTLAIDQVARVDFALEVGGVVESVNVQASGVLLDAATSTIGTVIENRQVTELPLSGRNPIALVALTPGVRIQGGFGGKGQWSNFSVNGGLANANTVLVEGLALDYAQMNSPAYVPPVDATQEFRIQTNNFAAEYGRSAGAVVNFSIRSGTNRLHGTVYEFFRNKSLDANSFFQNRAGNKRAALTYNQFGASIGGPIRKDKTFYFGNYEGYVRRAGSPTITTVPTALQRSGDFSQTFNAAGRMVAVADPLSTRQEAGIYVRDLFSGNRIPQSRFSRIASNYLPVWPQANAPGAPFTNLNNFSTFGGGGNNEHQYVTKLDHNMNSRWKFYGTWAHIKGNSFSVDPFRYQVNLTRPNENHLYNATMAANAVFSPTLIAEFHSGFARSVSDSIPYAVTQGFDMRTLGFPQAYYDAVQYKGFPGMDIAGIASVGSQSSHSLILATFNSWSQRGSVTWIRGSHTMKFGSDYRVQQLNQFQSNFFGGQYSFNNQMTATNPQRLDANSGIGMASFLLGNAAGGTVAKSERLANQRRYLSTFVQDDWKITRKLTLNLGMEYGFEFPITERYNRKMWYDPAAPLPISKDVGLDLRGGYRFADTKTRSPYDLFRRQISPRLGFAYQVFSGTVVRGGYGLFWLPAAITEVTGDVRAPAWSISTGMLGSIDGGLTPYHTLDNPFPNGIQAPPGSGQGLNTLVGQGGAANLRDFRTGYMQQWNLDIQRELGRGMIVEIAYAGSKGTGLPAQYGSQMNQLADEYLVLGTRLQELLPNPFFGFVQTGTLAQPTVQRGQLLRPYPQFTSLTLEGFPIGHSIYHSFQLQFNKRFGTSLVGVAYTVSKGIGNTESRSDWLEGGAQNASMRFLNNNNRSLDRSLNLFDNPQRLVISYSVDLPFGPGHKFLRDGGPFSRVVSGWQLSGIYTVQSGTPIGLDAINNLTGTFGGGSRPNNNGVTARLTSSPNARIDRWFDTGVFSQPPAFTYGTTGRTLPDTRHHGINNLDLGVFKNNRFGAEGRFNLQLRAELFNAANHVRFGYAGASFGNPQFGVISSQGNAPRQIQLALKLVY
ncbi:MAG TPA: carboxypeptidase-like regulatory domain-containing protein [Bryobacteraceae bacterium]|nr:carboxypeptidase-like regulatory domain-containing protein [Bryobacteraceae bacterium]